VSYWAIMSIPPRRPANWSVSKQPPATRFGSEPISPVREVDRASTSPPSAPAVFLFTDQGNLILGQLKPEGYTEISAQSSLTATFPLDGKKRAHGCPWPSQTTMVFARNDKELVCASLEARPQLAAVAEFL